MSVPGTDRGPIENAPHLWHLIVLGVIGADVVLTIPVFVGGLVRYSGLTDVQAGYAATAELTGTAIAAWFAIFWIDRIAWRTVCVLALSGLCLAELATALSHSYENILMLRFTRGVGSGSLIALAYGGLGRMPRSDKAFGLFSTAQLVYMVTALVLFPLILARFGFAGLCLALTLLSLTGMIAALSLPRVPSAYSAASGTPGATSKSKFPVLMLLAVTICFISQGAIWTFAERIGSSGGVRADQIGTILALGAVFGIAGALAATVTAGRLNRQIVLAVSSLALLASLVFLQGTIGALRFLLIVAVLKFVWNFTIPHQLGHLSEIDPSGRSAVLCSSLSLVGLAAGAGLSTVFIGIAGYIAPPAIAFVTWLAMTLMVISSLNRYQAKGLGEVHNGPLSI